MEGVNRIVSRIEAGAEAEAESILAKAEASRAEINARYEKEAKELSDKLEAEIEAAYQAKLEQGRKAADMEARKDILALKQELLASVFKRAETIICTLPEDKYVTILARLARDAALTGKEEVVLNKKDRAAVGEKVVEKANSLLGKKGALTLSAETREISGGLILKAGSIETNCSVELMVEDSKSELSPELVRRLFKPEGKA